MQPLLILSPLIGDPKERFDYAAPPGMQALGNNTAHFRAAEKASVM